MYNFQVNIYKFKVSILHYSELANTFPGMITAYRIQAML